MIAAIPGKKASRLVTSLILRPVVSGGPFTTTATTVRQAVSRTETARTLRSRVVFGSGQILMREIWLLFSSASS